MIRKLTEADRTEVLAYLEEDHSLNIFIIGDIENFGMETDFQSVYGEFNEQGEYQSVLLFYRKNAVYYSKKLVFNTDYIPYIKEVEPTIINGAKHLVELIYPHMENFDFRPMYFAEAQGFGVKEEYEDLEVVLMRTEKQAGELYDLLTSIEEFSTDKDPRDEFIASKMNSLDTGPTYLLYEDGVVISTVAVTAETSKTGMVIGVATMPLKRGKGYASKLMSRLMDEYFTKGKYLCLFYDNPKAGNIYKRLGFKDIDMYAMLVKERK